MKYLFKVCDIFSIPLITCFFYKQHFYKQRQDKIGKQHPEAELSLFENYALFSCTILFKNNRRCSKKVQKNKCVFFNDVTWLTRMKMKMKMKNRSERCDINRPRPRHGHKHTKYKMYLSIMMVICIMQHLSNIWSSIHEKFKQQRGWIEKKSVVSNKKTNVYSVIFVEADCVSSFTIIKEENVRNTFRI